jgi:glycerol-3-phosphate dehydrogenase
VNRTEQVGHLDAPFDVLIIGGGATGLGAAVDAAARGFRTALVEAVDFAKATSSRSTKLAHGGVRYLEQGNVGLVREALHERGAMRRNAPHLVDELAFVCPLYQWWEGPYYFAGLKAYDVLAGSANFHPSRYLSPRTTLQRMPDLKHSSLRGCILYYDGQFDDARLALALAKTAIDLGATVVNYARATSFLYSNGRACGAVVLDEEAGRSYEVRAKTVINATGIFVDELRTLDDPQAPPLLSHSRGTHVVFARDVFRGDSALLVPKTDDGRVLFGIPWHSHVMVGTTDIPVHGAELDPVPTLAEVDFIIAQFNKYLEKPVQRKDALAAFAGLRPLVSGGTAETKKLSREHLVLASKSGVVTVTGGKWTTYRKMAEDTIDEALRVAGIGAVPSRTATLPLHGSPGEGAHPSDAGYAMYGTERDMLVAIEREGPGLADPLHERLPYTRAEAVFAARSEMARTVDDVLARRTRALFIDNAAAREAAPAVAALMAAELGRDDAWQRAQIAAFDRIAEQDAVSIG